MKREAVILVPHFGAHEILQGRFNVASALGFEPHARQHLRIPNSSLFPSLFVRLFGKFIQAACLRFVTDTRMCCTHTADHISELAGDSHVKCNKRISGLLKKC